MIIYGTKAKTIPGDSIQGLTCPSCDQSSFNSFGVIRYFHIFWVPVFPTSRKVGVECTHCKYTALDKDFPQAIDRGVRKSIFTGARMLPIFSGSILLVLLVAVGWFSSGHDAARRLEYLQSPMINDLYIVDMTSLFDDIDSAYKYGVMKVLSFDETIVEVNVSNYGYRSPTVTASDLNRDMASGDFFSTESYSIDRQQLVALLHSRSIRDVRRSK